jgi:hypothetical protein
VDSVEKAIQAIQQLSDLGRKVPPRTMGSKLTGEAALKKKADELNVTEDEVRKAQKLVDPQQGYSQEELDQPFSHMRKQKRRRGEGRLFRRTHLIRLLSVDKKHRPRLQKLALQNGWTVRQLQRAIAARFGPRTHGGRRRSIPETAEEFWLDIELMCESWRRWRHELERDPPTGDKSGFGINRLNRAAVALIRATTEKIAELQGMAVERLAEKHPSRRMRYVET